VAYIRSEKLPEFIGGSQVHLLLGINSFAQPQFITTLPSGISVYRSPFIDIFGSDICYGGTHASLKAGATSGVSHAVHFTSAVNTVRSTLMEYMGMALEHHDNTLLPGVLHAEYTPPNPLPLEDHIDLFPTPLKEKGFVNSDMSIDPLNPLSFCEGVGLCVSSVHKASIPIAYYRNMVDPEDNTTLVTFRCPVCAKCVKCKESPRTQAITLNEAVEQEIIERSVTINYKKKAVYVDLPFLRDPVEFLSKRHRSSDSYAMAIHVYKQQCRLPENHKQKMREAHAELVQRGYMVNISDLDIPTQEMVMQAPFRHIYPWRIVAKEDSVSTPVRMVVDPTMTGLNLILAKGENRLGNLTEILIRSRVKRYAWSSDISKMYNQLKLNSSAYPYSLFLFHNSLDQAIPPDLYVILVAWYGLCPTGNQAGYAIDQIVKEAGEDFQEAKGPLSDDRYVDDVATGARTEEERELQIQACTKLLGSGGFSLKFVARSGCAPCNKASADGHSMKMLGYVWVPETDKFSPGTSELNFNVKKRGAKKPNETPVVTREDAEELMKDIPLTKKMCASKVAELWDPLGLWEPLKLQMKLQLSKLNGVRWDHVLPPQQQEMWKKSLLQVVDFPKLEIERCVIPPTAINPGEARLICLSDAAVNAGGVAVYIGFELPDGSYSSQLLTAKSKLLSATIPRNELMAVLLMTEVAFVVNKSLKGLVKDILYVTDSTIAMSWCHNLNRKLKTYVHSRVESVRRMIEWTDQSIEELPLVHIDGTMNIADLLTKHHDISVSDLGPDSEWHKGMDWMTLPVEKMPIMRDTNN
jgi:hypothetical protein